MAAPMASAAAADEALKHLIERHKRQVRTAAPPRRPRPSLEARIERLQQRAAHLLVRTGVARWAPRLIGAAACCGLLWAAYLVIPKPTRLHGVAGSVRVNDEPLRDGLLEFQLQGPAAQGKRFWTAMQTDADGAFRRDAAVGLPEGRYAVAVRPRRQPGAAGLRAVAVPSAYTQLRSTPLAVEIRGTTGDLELVIQ
ncbi:MAG: hypothetical protein EBZ74_03530 [Planctomycetia bacterium]|nr:hypothetical protein [Planctomycetia bacterium]